MSDIEDDNERRIEEYKKYLMPVEMSNISKMIEKFGSDISDDLVFVLLTASIFMKHDRDWGNGKYDKELVPISNEIGRLEKEYGLKDGEYFPIGSSPEEIEKLNKEYSNILDKKCIELFKKFDLGDFANLYQNDHEAFMKRFSDSQNKFGDSDSLKEVILILEDEAKKCSKIAAYNAASIVMSAAIESIIYRACAKNHDFHKVLFAYNKRLDNKKRKQISKLSFGQLIKFAKTANIYPFNRDVEKADTLLRLANDVRNLIHPGRKLLSKVLRLQKNDYEFLLALFTLLKDYYLPSFTEKQP